MQPTHYEVRFIVVVDHPELRGPTFPEVPPGARLPQVFKFEDQRRALQFFQGVMDGGWDASSEYATDITVLRCYERRSPAYVRKPIGRARGLDGKVVSR